MMSEERDDQGTAADIGRASENTTALAPRTRPGWVAVALGFGTLLVVVLTFVLLGSISNGGDTPTPIWVRIAIFGGILVVAVPAVWLGFRARRTDPSYMGLAALVIAGVLGGWFALTGALSMFFE